ncbi:MAG: phosphoribosylanthranilate isomerase [Clostridiales Family XIII bacterium]|jgi:phosphoribosylanthranilate isomerase|nr:phosphoribosylanthranilate isomerase [Clostridiales Family XIII bacterium]
MNTKIKICGLSRLEDIAAVNEARPDYIGFVFAEKSRRKVVAAEAADLRVQLAKGIIPVGVFVNAPIDEIANLYKTGTIEVAQLHGGEDEEYIENLRQATAAIKIIKAFQIDTVIDIAKAAASSADYVLLDHGTGGTGKVFNWEFVGNFREITEKPFFLAGGIDEANIKDALALEPYCIDVSSGAETDGVKDGDKIKSLVR